MYIQKIEPYKVDYYGDVRTLITGLSYQCPNDWESILEALDSQSDLTLRKEPDNPHDSHAIAAYLGDRRIGYVSKDDNCAIIMFLGDETVKCKVIEKYNASFKISFEHPKKKYEAYTPEQIFQLQPDCKYQGYDKNMPSYEIPIIEKGDENYDWFDDTIVIPVMEKWIVDFNRKFVSNKIELVCRQADDGKFHYCLPYLNWDIADVEPQEICDKLERVGIGIALVEQARLSYRDALVVHLKVGLHKDYRGTTAMSYFMMKRKNKDFNFIYEMPKEAKTLSITEEEFSKFISENFGYDVLNAPNSSWRYIYTDVLNRGAETRDIYIFKKYNFDNPKCEEIKAAVPRGTSVNFIMDVKMNKMEILDFVYKYKKLFYPDYRLSKCHVEYGGESSFITLDDVSPWLSVRLPNWGDPCSISFYTTFCNKAYIDELKAKGKINSFNE